MRRVTILGVALLISLSAHAIVYVDNANVSGTEDGTSWTTAFTKLQDGVDAAAASGDTEVWVAQGTYDEERVSLNSLNVDTGSLVLRPGLGIYGGFAGTETARDQRNPDPTRTIIDGSTARNGDRAIHVVVGDDGCTLDGFTIQGGWAEHRVSGYPLWRESGGGMWNGSYDRSISISLNNLVFRDNYAYINGGAVNSIDSNAEIRNCRFEDNTCAFGGGALTHQGSSLLLVGCTFEGNTAGYGGGAAQFLNSGPNKTYVTVQRCVFIGNSQRETVEFDGLGGQPAL